MNNPLFIIFIPFPSQFTSMSFKNFNNMLKIMAIGGYLYKTKPSEESFRKTIDREISRGNTNWVAKKILSTVISRSIKITFKDYMFFRIAEVDSENQTYYAVGIVQNWF